MAKQFLSTVALPSLNTSPQGSLPGELYYNSEEKTVYVFDGSIWGPVSVDYLKQMFLGGSHQGIEVSYNEGTQSLDLKLAGVDYSQEPSGFPDKSQSLLTFDEATRTVTIQPNTNEGNDSFDVYIAGKKIVKTTANNLTLPATPGIYYVYYNQNYDLAQSSTVFDFQYDVSVATIILGHSLSALYFSDERHGIVMDWATQYYLRRTDGTQIVDGGFNAGNYTLGGDGTTDLDAKFSIGNGTLFNEDKDFNISHSDTPSAIGEQYLNPNTRVPVFYRMNEHWEMSNVTDYAFHSVNNVPQINQLDSGVWSLSPVGNNKYFASYIFATGNILSPIASVMGQRVDTNIGNAIANNNYLDLDLSGAPATEIAPLYRIIYKYNTNYTSTSKVTIQDVSSIKKSSGSSASSVSSNDHGNLVGLNDDDHVQYVHISNPRTITASHTFNNPGAPFILGPNSSGQLVIGLNSEKLGGKTLSEVEQTAFGYAQDAQSAALAAARGYTDQEIADLVGTAPDLLNTLGELSDALNDDASFAATVTSALAGKASTTHTHAASSITNFSEEVQDAAASLFTHLNHNNITASYDDVTNQIVFTATAQLTQEQVQDFVSPLLVHNNHTNIQAAYDDDNNQLVLEAIIPPSKAIMSSTAPVDPDNGEFWLDTDEFRGGVRALKLYNKYPAAYKGDYDNGQYYALNDVVSIPEGSPYGIVGSFFIRSGNPGNPGYPPEPGGATNGSWTLYSFTGSWEYVSSDLSVSTTNVWTAKNTFNNGVIIGLNSAPTAPVLGQIYYDSTTLKLRAYNGTAWVNIEGGGGGGGAAFDLVSTDTSAVPAIMFFGAVAPTTAPNTGDIWIDIDDVVGESEYIHVGPDAPSNFGSNTLWVDTDEVNGPLIYSDEDPPTTTPTEGDFWVDLDDLSGQLVSVGSVAPDEDTTTLWIDTTTEEGLENFTIKNVFEGNRSVYSTYSALPNAATHGGMIAFVESEQQFYLAFSDVPTITNGLTFTVTKTESPMQYIINNNAEPEINLERGKRYIFNVNTPGHPFWIKTEAITGVDYGYPTGVTNNGISSGTITFDVPYNAPDELFYICQNHAHMTNKINITGVVNPTGGWNRLLPDRVQDNMVVLSWMGF
jgi:hypothetical protein